MDNGSNALTGICSHQGPKGANPKSHSAERPSKTFEDLFQRVSSKRSATSGDGRGQLVRLGTLSDEHPTVSHLLMQHPEYGENCWEIVHAPSNRDKPFRDMARGAEVWLDPRNREIIVDNDAGAKQSPTAASADRPEVATSNLFRANKPGNGEAPTLSTRDLNSAVTDYCGTPYNKLNCYELVVQGLKDLGVDYSGRDGLQHELMQQARLDDRAPNAYLTGEGLIRSLGSPVFSEELSEIDNPETKARELLKTLDTRLQPGMILSLSTPEGGHTGIISRRNDQWTFINSGSIQNAVNGEAVRRGVAEEDLFSELAGWLERAQNRGSGLSVSVGGLSPDKLGRFADPQGGIATSA